MEKFQMPEIIKYTIEEANHYFAISYNNAIWQLLEKKEDTEEAHNEIINLAHASLLHWSKSAACKNVNLLRGEYMIALAYINAVRKEAALYYAGRCMQMTAQYKNEVKDFDIAHSLLVMAMALNLNGNKDEAREYMEKAREAGELIRNPEDKRIFMGDLKSAFPF